MRNFHSQTYLLLIIVSLAFIGNFVHSKIPWYVKTAVKLDWSVPVKSVSDIDFTSDTINNASIPSLVHHSSKDHANNLSFINLFPVSPAPYTVIIDRQMIKLIVLPSDNFSQWIFLLKISSSIYSRIGQENCVISLWTISKALKFICRALRKQLSVLANLLCFTNANERKKNT